MSRPSSSAAAWPSSCSSEGVTEWPRQQPRHVSGLEVGVAEEGCKSHCGHKFGRHQLQHTCEAPGGISTHLELWEVGPGQHKQLRPLHWEGEGIENGCSARRE